MSVRVVRPLSWRETKLYYQVGSTFKGCFQCGSIRVLRSHCPGDMGWWHYCWDCSAMDDQCWPMPGGTDKKSPYMKTEERKRRDLERGALMGDEAAFEALPAAKRAAITRARSRAELGGGKAFSEMSKDERLALLIEQGRMMDEAKRAKGTHRRSECAPKAAVNAQIAEIQALIAQLQAKGVSA